MKYFSLVFALLLSNHLFSQTGFVKVKVVDFNTKEVYANATVLTYNIDETASETLLEEYKTNHKGLAIIETEQHLIAIRAKDIVGRTSKRTAVKVKIGDTISVEISMAEIVEYDEAIEEHSERRYKEDAMGGTLAPSMSKAFKLTTAKKAMTADFAIMDASGSGQTVKAGALTAGEINDFNKWNLWKTINDEGLEKHASTWKMTPRNRISFLLQNSLGGPVVGAQVILKHKSDNVWIAQTDNLGSAELWIALLEPNSVKILDQLSAEIHYQEQVFRVEDLVAYENGINLVELPVECNESNLVDIAFVVDATGSMSDEIRYLQAELEDIIKKAKEGVRDIELNIGSIFYRDNGDAYVTRQSPFSNNIAVTNRFIAEQEAGGGGDFPEALDSALSQAINSLAWNKNARTKLLFLLADAPPHSDSASLARIKKATEKAAKLGIKIIPIAVSGVDKSTEYLMRSMALATNGTYVFLTNHSGIGNDHIEPTTDQYDVRKFNELLQEIIERYATVADCFGDKDLPTNNHTIITSEIVDSSKLQLVEIMPEKIKATVIGKTGEVHQLNSNKIHPVDSLEILLFPNPASFGFVNINLGFETESCLLLDMNGKLVRQFNTGGLKHFKADLAGIPSGNYFIVARHAKGSVTEKLIVSL
ncbi:MAG: VWA domain-containing protein [Bacteroidetes bacterium]|nr:VWA domain-containing protein [Bacteroidota bacterium]